MTTKKLIAAIEQMEQGNPEEQIDAELELYDQLKHNAERGDTIANEFCQSRGYELEIEAA